MAIHTAKVLTFWGHREHTAFEEHPIRTLLVMATDHQGALSECQREELQLAAILHGTMVSLKGKEEYQVGSWVKNLQYSTANLWQLKEDLCLSPFHKCLKTVLRTPVHNQSEITVVDSHSHFIYNSFFKLYLYGHNELTFPQELVGGYVWHRVEHHV